MGQLTLLSAKELKQHSTSQVDFLSGDDATVLERLAPVADELPGYLTCQLLRGRAAERRDQSPQSRDGISLRGLGKKGLFPVGFFKSDETDFAAD